MRECLPTPLERAGTLASQPGPYFFGEIRERTPRGRRFLPLGTPFSGGRNGGRRFRQVGAWPAASKTNASWPAHQLGRAGRYEPFAVRAAGQVSRQRYSLPHTTPPEKGVPGEEPPPPGVLSPISSQEMGPRPGRPRFPAVPTAWGQNHKGTPPGRAKFPPVPTALKKRPASAGKTPRQNLKDQESVILWQNSPP